MTENIDWKMNEDDERLQEEPSSSRHLLIALEDLLKRSHHTSTFISKNKYQSKSVDDLLLYRLGKHADQSISTVTHTELDLSGIGYDDDDVGEETNQFNSPIQRSRSAPASPTKIYEKELAAFIDCDQPAQQFIADHFIYNIDLSDSNETSSSHPCNSKLAIFFEDDFLSEEINYEPSVSLLHSSLINNCVTITEENEEELEQLRRDDHQCESIIIENDEEINNSFDQSETNMERLSTIYESPSPQPDIDDNLYEKLIVYDIGNIETSTVNPISSFSTFIDRTRFRDTSSFEPCPNLTNTLTASRLCGTTNLEKNSFSSTLINNPIVPLSLSLKPSVPQQQYSSSSSRSSPMLFPIDGNNKKLASSHHVTKMKVIQSSLSTLSDFISSTPMSTLPNTSSTNDKSIPNINERRPSFTRGILTNGLLLSHCATNPIPRRTQPLIKIPIDEKLRSDSSSSSSEMCSSSSDEKLLSRSDYLVQNERKISPQRKSSSLKSIPIILYPIDFNTNHSWHQNQSHKVPTSDSGIVIDTKSTIEEDDNYLNDQLQQYEINYRQTLTDLRLIKQHLVDIDSRLNEAMRELEIEQALIEGEHELVFKQILDASKSDQVKIQQLYHNLQVLVERIMTEKNSLRNEIYCTEQTLRKHEQELDELERNYQSSDEIILKKKEVIAANRKRYEDLEFQLMEFETRCETELEQAEKHFQTEQKLLTQNAKFRQETLHELDHQQYLVLHQSTLENDKLEREKQKYKFLFKQKQIEANELEQTIHGTNRAIYQTTLNNLFNSSPQMKHQSNQVRFDQTSFGERYDSDIRRNYDYQVQLRDKNRAQERPLTRYLPICSANFNLRAHIEGAGHFLDCSHVSLTSTSCRGYLQKMGGMKFKTWNRRWFVFDRQSHSLFYYQDKSETKLRGCISFQSILEVYVDHLQSMTLRSPEPREATFIVKTIGRSFYLVAPTVELMRMWVDVIITGAEGNTFARN